MTLDELKQTTWYKERPKIIQQTIDILPPNNLYKFKDTGKQCKIYSYEKPENGLLEDVTVTVQKTGIGGIMDEMGLSVLDKNQVFGVKLTDLEIWN